MPFNNPIVGGDYLIRPAIESPDYVAGVSGWRIARDGTVEFNNGTFRGQVELGNPSGQHLILANSANGDALDVYNSSNTLVYNISNQGAATSYEPTNTNFQAAVLDAELSLSGPNGGATQFYSEPFPFGGGSRVQHTISQVVPGRGANYELDAYGGSSDGSQPPTLVGTEQGITGSVMQSDQITSGNLVHVGNYTGTVNDGFGDVVIGHGAAFNPSWGILTPWDWNGVGQGWLFEWFQIPFVAGNMRFFVRQQGGGIPPINTVVGCHAVLFK